MSIIYEGEEIRSLEEKIRSVRSRSAAEVDNEYNLCRRGD